MDYTDEINLLSHSRCCQDDSSRVQRNITKTKNLRINACASQKAPFTFDSQAIEEVDLFTYLGSTVSKTGGTDEVVKATINKARQAFAILRAVWTSNNLSCGTKLRQCRQTSSPVRGSGLSGVTKNLDHKLQVFINICLRHILCLLRIG